MWSKVCSTVVFGHKLANDAAFTVKKFKYERTICAISSKELRVVVTHFYFCGCNHRYTVFISNSVVVTWNHVGRFLMYAKQCVF